MHTSAQGIKAHADCHGPGHVIIFIVLIDNLCPVTNAKYRRSGKGRTKKRTAQFKRRHGRKSGRWFWGSIEFVG
jgi:hypothetical protein